MWSARGGESIDLSAYPCEYARTKIFLWGEGGDMDLWGGIPGLPPLPRITPGY